MFAFQSARLKTGLITASLIGGYGASTYLSDNVVLNVGGAPAFWAANSFLIAGLLLLNGQARLVCLAGCLLLCGVFAYAWDSHVLRALWFVAMSGALSILVAWLTRKICRTPQIRNLKQAMKLLGLVILPVTLLGSAIMALTLKIQTGAPFTPLAIQWFMASFMGTSMVLPTLLLLTTRSRARTAARSRLELGVLAIMIGLMIIGSWTPWYMLMLILAFPAATLFAMRLGGRATTVSLLLITLSAFVYPFAFPDQPGANDTARGVNQVIFGFQIYITIVFYSGLMTAMALDHRTRTRRQLERRTAIARAARSRAQTASQAKTEFLAAMSHELRTPLNGVLGFTQILLQRKALPRDIRRNLELIGKSGDALLLIVNDVLDYSRIESGRIDLKTGPVLVSALAREAVAIVDVQARVKGITVSATTEGEDSRRLLLDEARLRQILLNLLDNAVKFTDAGKVELKVSLAGEIARFAVTDTGVGIPEDKQSALFDGFTQVDGSLTRAHGGTGIGLAICKSLVQLMDGRIGVESRAGRGSTFWFEIPFRTADVAETPERVEEERAAHILVVDDHPVNRELATTILGLLGCTSDAVENGAEAVAAVRTQVYDAILMDVHMPVMDGVAAARAIRAMSETVGHIPIIGLSADVTLASVDRCRAAGMDDHLGKPVNVAKLQGSLMRCFPQAGQDTEVAA